MNTKSDIELKQVDARLVALSAQRVAVLRHKLYLAEEQHEELVARMPVTPPPVRPTLKPASRRNPYRDPRAG